jgi:uncharacterized protein YbjQ (UPF0145 family)
MCEQTRTSSYDMMMQDASRRGANAVIGMRYDAAEVGQNASEVICYGTAVIIEPIREEYSIG